MGTAYVVRQFVTMGLQELLSTPFVIPSIPRVVALALTELGRPRPDLRRLAQLLGTDPALSCRLLQIANAAGLAGKLHGVSEALAVLRLDEVRTLVMHAASSATFKAVPGIQLAQFWSYSLDAARVSRAIAGLLHLDPQAAYCVGMIHAVGELLLRVALPNIVALDAKVGVFEPKRARAELQAVGFCFTQVTAGLARQWKLPHNMFDALEFQHKPFDNDPYEPLAGVLHLALWRARARQLQWSQRALAVSFPALVAEVLGLDIDMVLQQDPIDWTPVRSGPAPQRSRTAVS
ncbi:HDOD domain-containing protein [Candidatus Symbiobacter mobilis]|uniref:HDOD domain-containing protein n=1 Tax=Candidatus Symbiobacter mobilis TaxID=1436290 RepID=UPI0030838E47